jgi:hypothetical protein
MGSLSYFISNPKTIGDYTRGGAPPILYVPMEIFLFYEMGKKRGNNKESCLHNKVRFPYSRGSGTPLLGLMPLGAPFCRTRMGTSPTTNLVNDLGFGDSHLFVDPLLISPVVNRGVEPF